MSIHIHSPCNHNFIHPTNKSNNIYNLFKKFSATANSRVPRYLTLSHYSLRILQGRYVMIIAKNELQVSKTLWPLAARFRTKIRGSPSTILKRYIERGRGHAVAQLVETLRYKSEGRGFDSQWCHLNFAFT